MLTPDQARDRAHDIVQRAKAAGADAADAVFAADAALDVSIRLGKLEDIGRSESEDLGLRVFVGQRSASVSTSDLSTAAMDALVERAVAMAREAPEDPWAGLAPADRLLHGITPMLGLDDGGEVSPEQLRDAALEAEDAARAVPGVSNSEGGGASASRSVWALATSHGFAGAYAATGYGVSASVLAGEGSAMQRDYAHSSARLRAHLEAPEAIGRRAGEQAVARLNPGRLASGAMPVVFDPRVGSSLLGHLLGANVSPWRWPLVWAALAAIVVGAGFTALPKRYEWVELAVGEPAIAATYLYILWKYAFGPADRALFAKKPAKDASLPNAGAPVA